MAATVEAATTTLLHRATRTADGGLEKARQLGLLVACLGLPFQKSKVLSSLGLLAAFSSLPSSRLRRRQRDSHADAAASRDRVGMDLDLEEFQSPASK